MRYQDLTGPGRTQCWHSRSYTNMAGRRICVDCGEDLGPDQLANLPAPRASSAHPETSHGAARVASQAALGRRRTVLKWFQARSKKGGTIYEAAEATGITVQSICGVVKDLRDAGFLSRESEDTRPSPSGNPSRVHHITNLGLKALEEIP